MDFKRHITRELSKWKTSKNRKPLILRGARQVGKTTVAHQFAQSYTHSIVLNLERSSDLRYFKEFTDARTIVDALFVANSIPSNQMSNTLLFIDEIQESPEAISLLRYFYEDVPILHVMAAGSLLEHVMKKVKSFPVGRVEYRYMYPLNFMEFLEAIEHVRALEQFDDLPIEDFSHTVLQELFHQYAIIGGMPEVISTYLETKSVADLQPVYESIWATYKDDVEKYARNTTDARVIRHIMDTAPAYIDERIKFQNFGNSNYKSREVGESFRNLNDARVIQLIYPTTEMQPPVRPDLKKYPRLQFLDTGLLNYELGIQVELLSMNDLDPAFKGRIIPHIITQELMSLNTLSYRKPNFWVREKAQSSAEVDLVFPYKSMIIPIEIKSGKAGKLRSLHQFIDRAGHPYAIRMFAGRFSIEEHKTPTGTPYLLMNLPYYLGTKISEYLTYFINSHQL